MIAGPFETMTDVWDRLMAFEKKWEEEAMFDDAHANNLRAVEERVGKSINVLKAEQEALKRQLADARGSIKDQRHPNAIHNELKKRGDETLQQDATLPCLHCGAKDCLLCDWCGESCTGKGHDRRNCTGASKHEAGDTCFRCFEPRNSKSFPKPTKKHMHKPDQCKACPRKVQVKLRLVEKGHLVLWRSGENGTVVWKPWHHCQRYREKGWKAWKDTAAKNKQVKEAKKAEQQLAGAVAKKPWKMGMDKDGKGNGKGKGKGKGKGNEGKGKKDWTCKHCDTRNRPWRTTCFNSDCQSGKAESSTKAVTAVQQTVTCTLPRDTQELRQKKQKVGFKSPTGAGGTSRSADYMPTSSSYAVKAKAARCRSCHKPWASCLCKHALTHDNLLMHVSAQEKEKVCTKGTSLLQTSSTGSTRTTQMMSESETEEQTVREQPTVPELLYSDSESSKCGMSDVSIKAGISS